MKKTILMLIAVVFLLSIVSCTQQIEPKPISTPTPDPKPIVVDETFDFENSDQGFTGGFADYPEGEEEFYELDSNISDIPNLDTKGFMLKGNNHSDDLLMYITRGFDVSPNTAYTVDLTFKLATNVPGNMMGIGGSPGASVYVKAGAANIPFVPELDDSGYLRSNWDIGEQSNGGMDAVVVGNIEKKDSDDDSYQFKDFDAQFEVTSDDNGKVYILLATDSGFEGITQIYFDDVIVKIYPKE